MVTDGARDLRAWISKRYPKGTGGVPKFCEDRGLDRIAVQRAMNGETRRISVDLACEIQDATGGAVKVPRWRSATAIPGIERKRAGSTEGKAA